MTDAELLAEVETTIRKVLSGQRAMWDGNSVELADLETLYKIRSDLRRSVEGGRAGGSGLRYRRANFTMR